MIGEFGRILASVFIPLLLASVFGTYAGRWSGNEGGRIAIIAAAIGALIGVYLVYTFNPVNLL